MNDFHVTRWLSEDQDSLYGDDESVSWRNRMQLRTDRGHLLPPMRERNHGYQLLRSPYTYPSSLSIPLDEQRESSAGVAGTHPPRTAEEGRCDSTRLPRLKQPLQSRGHAHQVTPGLAADLAPINQNTQPTYVSHKELSEHQRAKLPSPEMRERAIGSAEKANGPLSTTGTEQGDYNLQDEGLSKRTESTETGAIGATTKASPMGPRPPTKTPLPSRSRLAWKIQAQELKKDDGSGIDPGSECQAEASQKADHITSVPTPTNAKPPTFAARRRLKRMDITNIIDTKLTSRDHTEDARGVAEMKRLLGIDGRLDESKAAAKIEDTPKDPTVYGTQRDVFPPMDAIRLLQKDYHDGSEPYFESKTVNTMLGKKDAKMTDRKGPMHSKDASLDHFATVDLESDGEDEWEKVGGLEDEWEVV